MKLYKTLLLGAVALMTIVSCADNEQLSFSVDEPASITSLKYLNDYNVLKSYVNNSTDPNFKLGVGVSVSSFNSNGVEYRLISSNFAEMTAGYEMKHGAVVQDDGSLALDGIKTFIANAKTAGVSIFGHTLCWHANQNAKYLNSLIAPTVVPGAGDPRWEVVTEQKFETSDASNYSYNSNAQASFTATGQGNGDGGRALKITNALVRDNDWNCQMFVTFPRAVVAGEKWRLTMDVKSDATASYSTQAHTAPGAYKFWDFFGTITSTSQWATYTKEITISSDQATCNTIAFNLGKTATNYYFDNIKVEFFNQHPTSGTVEKTPEEKRQIIDAELDRWISGMVDSCKTYVKAWDVVNEPMSDWPDPSLLKTGVGKTLGQDEFYWQDYLGKDYAVRAFQIARQHCNAGDKLFINEYGLEGADQAKCAGLIAYVSYIESKGQKVDGIGTQMHVTLGQTSMEGIRAMFTKLAATGKLIKISELDMGIRPAGSTTNLIVSELTDQQQKEMAAFYKQIIKAYFEIIPAAQRYGITQWAITDSPAGSSWRPNEPIGLWTKDHSRKHAYAGFADGLAGK
ncbi:MAG: hypothetical protein BGN96_11380 [Bacteroidales bacterium 45-6]|nr:MAG: hypothetical protein BGN96_11380 [Bacteroidales bacterium 45-6]